MNEGLKLEIFGTQELIDLFESMIPYDQKRVYLAALRKTGLILAKQAKDNFKSIYKNSSKRKSSVKLSQGRSGKLSLKEITPVSRFLNKIVVTNSDSNDIEVLVGGLKVGLGRLFHLFEDGSKNRVFVLKKSSNGKAGFYKTKRKTHYTGRMTSTHFWQQANEMSSEKMETAIRTAIISEWDKMIKRKSKRA
jgi:hypothetical protein